MNVVIEMNNSLNDNYSFLKICRNMKKLRPSSKGCMNVNDNFIKYYMVISLRTHTERANKNRLASVNLKPGERHRRKSCSLLSSMLRASLAQNKARWIEITNRALPCMDSPCYTLT